MSFSPGLISHHQQTTTCDECSSLRSDWDEEVCVDRGLTQLMHDRPIFMHTSAGETVIADAEVGQSVLRFCVNSRC